MHTFQPDEPNVDAEIDCKIPNKIMLYFSVYKSNTVIKISLNVLAGLTIGKLLGFPQENT